MKLGIKVAPGNAYKQDIEATHPAMVEVWYNVTKPDDYTELFAYLKTQPLEVGLHFWGMLTDQLLPNISFPDPAIVKKSMELITRTIDTAANHGFSYVNMHSDLYALLQVNFETMAIHLISEPTDRVNAQQRFIHQVQQLHQYAQSRGIILTIETVPQRDAPTWNPNRNRREILNIHQMPIDVHIALADQGMYIANDFCHTACNVISDHRATVAQFLFTTTKRLAGQTKLIHLGYVVPPYNGVDFHDSLANPILNTQDAIPNNSEMIDLLKLFQKRDDIWILVEPKEDHIKNFLLAKKLIETASS